MQLIKIILLLLVSPNLLAAAGIAGIWADFDDFDNAFVKYAQISVNWGPTTYGTPGMETSDGVFDWTTFDNQYSQYVTSRGKSVFLDFSGNFKPPWLTSSVTWCNRALHHQEKTTYNGQKVTYAYWTNPYINQIQDAIAALGAKTKAENNGGEFVAVRYNLNRVGTEDSLGSVGECGSAGGTWSPSTPSFFDNNYNSKIATSYLNAFSDTDPDQNVTLMLRAETNLSSLEQGILNNGTGTLKITGLNREPLTNYLIESRYGNLFDYCRVGTVEDCFCETYDNSFGERNSGTLFVDNPWGYRNLQGGMSDNYWAMLFGMHSGCSVLGIYGDDIVRGETETEYSDVYNWVNDVAGYHAKLDQAPEVWFAFREGNINPGNYCVGFPLAGRTCPHTVNSGSFNGIDYANDGTAEFGAAQTRHRSWARKLNGSITINMESAFVNSTSGEDRNVLIDYYDKGTDTISVTAFGQSYNITRTNTLAWMTDTEVVSGGDDSTAITIVGTDANLQLVRVQRTQAASTPTPPVGTDNALLYFNSGQDLEPGAKTFFSTESAIDSNGVLSFTVTDGTNTVEADILNDTNGGGYLHWPDLSTILSGPVTLELGWDTPVYDSQYDTALTASSTYNVGALTAYSGSHANYATGGVRFENLAGGYGNIAMTTPNAISVNAGQQIRIRYRIAGDTCGNPLGFWISEDATSNRYQIEGLPCSLSEVNTYGSNTGYETWSDGFAYYVDMWMTAPVTAKYEYKFNIPTADAGDCAEVTRVQMWVDPNPTLSTKSFTAANTGNTGPTPTAPTLISCVAEKDENDSSLIGGRCDSDQIGSLLYGVITNSSTPPEAPQILDGKDDQWNDPEAAASVEITILEDQELIFPATDPLVDRYVYFVAVNPDGQTSNVIGATMIPAEVTAALTLSVASGLLPNYTSFQLFDNRNSTTPLVDFGAVTTSGGAVDLLEADVVSGSLNSLVADKNYWFKGSYEPTSLITGATQADPIVITAPSHCVPNPATEPGAKYTKVYIDGVGGMIELNKERYRAVYVDGDTLELRNYENTADIDSTAFTAYTSGGTIECASSYQRTYLKVTEVP